MAFELKTDEPVGRGLERISKKTLRKSCDALAAERPADAVHAARTSVKKVRAILAMVDGAAKHTGGIEKRLKHVARCLSSLRDAHAIAETCARIADRAPTEIKAALAAAARSLSSEARRLEHQAAEEDAFRTIGKDLRRAKRRLRRAHLERVDMRDIADGIERTYRRGRRALAAVQNDPDADRFHRWRKRVKTLWYHLRLLGQRWKTQPAVAALATIEECLGEDHNLAILRERLSVIAPFRDTALRTAVDQYCCACQMGLRQRALESGRHFYAATAKRFVGQWRRSQRAASEPASRSDRSRRRSDGARSAGDDRRSHQRRRRPEDDRRRVA